MVSGIEPSPVIDLYSDAQTQPTPGMRQAMAATVVGDEPSDEAPSTLRLCERIAGLLGMEAGVFMPSGTMCNLVAILVHTRPGDEVICDGSSHVYCTEAAGAAVIAGVSIRPVDSAHSVFGPEDVVRALRHNARTAPKRSCWWSSSRQTSPRVPCGHSSLFAPCATLPAGMTSGLTSMARGSSMPWQPPESLPTASHVAGTVPGWI